MKGMRLKELAFALGTASHSEKIIHGYAIDSRLAGEGDLFFAMPGKKVRGEQFLKEVSEKKGVAAIVPKTYSGEDFGLQLIRVEDVGICLQQLATRAFLKRKEKVIAITGSVGKTTTKEFLSTLLSKKFRVGKTLGNANSQLTLPLTILNLDANYDYLVLEMGMSFPGEIRKLVEIAPPDIGVVTGLALSHAENFPNGIEGIAAAKAEIFSQPRTDLAVLGVETAQTQPFKNLALKKITYRFLSNCAADFNISLGSNGYRIGRGDELSPCFSLPIHATHLVENFLAAAVVCRQIGMSWEEIIDAARGLRPHDLRFEMVEKEGITFIKDCYNANPASMCAALKNLPKPSKRCRRIAVIGSMKELGRFSEESHRQIGELALGIVDEIICIGAECTPLIEVFQKEKKPALLCENLAQVKEKLFDLVCTGDVVLIKGSKSHQLWKLFEE